MNLSTIERETIINFNSTQEDVSVFTSQPEVWRRLEKIDGFKVIQTEEVDYAVRAKEFLCPKRFVRLISSGIIVGKPRKVSDRQREHMRTVRKSILSSKSLI